MTSPRLISIVFLLTTLSTTYAAPTSSGYVPPGAKCQDYFIPVDVASLNYPWVAPKWTDNFGFIDFLSVATSRTDAGFPPPIGAAVNETARYNIGATFCTPTGKSNANAGKVLLATHGLGFDRSYWNPFYKPKEYNFVQFAIDRGYSIFFYDRLGVGSSTKVSGFVNQLNIQTSVLAELITNVRSGQYTTLSTPPTAVILVGHSFGSSLTNSLVAAKPDLADAAIMTGYGLKGSDTRLDLQGFAPRVANPNNNPPSSPIPQIRPYDTGYITTADVFANINNFFKAPAYTHDVAEYSEATKQPFAISELVSLTPSLLNLNATAFKGPALVISGEFDYIVCGGYCPGELEPSLAPLFTGAKDFETYVQPLAGHGLNFATNATGAYGVIFEYLGRNGF